MKNKSARITQISGHQKGIVHFYCESNHKAKIKAYLQGKLLRRKKRLPTTVNSHIPDQVENIKQECVSSVNILKKTWRLFFNLRICGKFLYSKRMLPNLVQRLEISIEIYMIFHSLCTFQHAKSRIQNPPSTCCCVFKVPDLYTT